ncbi:MAG: Flp pilus assembly complex ATPase component TadA [Candidatus Riflebacteria bacterium]|nr:Flp pilus assembly complex ATPase component TadA [Candidatus Riflebacteria bacterium]
MEQINQNISKSEIKADNFGILPWTYEPGFFSRLFGQKPYVVDAENIVFYSEKKEVNLPYSEIEAIECSDNVIHIKAVENKDYSFKAGKEAADVSNLILRLAREYNEYKSLMNIDKIVTQLGFAYFLKSFSYRGNPFVRAVEILLKTAVDNNFSDIHFEPAENSIKVSYRISGKLRYGLELSKVNYEHFIARVKYLAGCDNQLNNKPQEGAFRFVNTDIRFSTFPTDLGERASFRMIGAVKFPNVRSLGWSDEAREQWLNMIKEETGLFIITGSVGSGKTTAMYATLSELVSSADGQLRVVSIEDPVEAYISGICQSSYDSKIEESLASAFKHLLRQDPDVIALGEIRDVSSIVEALQAGLSGHLVFATFHAGSPDEAIDRIKMMASANKLILAGLKGILHLKLSYNESKVIQTPTVKRINFQDIK